VRIRKQADDPDSVAPKFWQGSRRRAPPGIADNMIQTTKYSPVTFFPKVKSNDVRFLKMTHDLKYCCFAQNLFEQFRRLFNVYWLMQCVVVLIPGFSPVSPLSTIGGFAFVLGVTCVKDAYEDYQRYLADSEANNLPVQVLRNGVFESTASMSLLVGDIVLVKKDEPFPADLAIVSCSDTEDICYIETSNLDGERNLKRAYPMVSIDLVEL
jgi:phospholipid-transporting ATPase